MATAGQQQVPPRQAWGLPVLMAATYAKSPSLRRPLARPRNQPQASGLSGGVSAPRPPRAVGVAPQMRPRLQTVPPN